MSTPATLSTLIDRYISHQEFAGAAVIALKHGKIVLEHYAGRLPLGWRRVPTSVGRSLISKVYSAATIMRLVELGELTLNTRASSLLPAFCGGSRDAVRIRHLLTHTAGLMYESPVMAARLQRTALADMLNEAIESTPLFVAGTQLSYSDYHWLIFANIAETITGMSFAAAMQSLLLTPSA
jgi:CubicO group peptidase (beta-lactamase class C family)